MKIFRSTMSSILGLTLVCLFAENTTARQNDAEAQAKKLLDMSGVQGGIVVHLGCGEGQLTAALRNGDGFTVHGLECDPAKVQAARSRLLAAGVYGPVSIEAFEGTTLPYADNLINLVVVEESGDISTDEVMRVLAPLGTACFLRNGTWEKVVKPRPENIDDWSHFLHDASNNAVAQDTVVGPPRRVQWIAPPLWLRSHETPSGIQASVSAGGRLFYFFDEGLIGITDERLPDRWSLVCRDAFNGKLLWKRPLGPWGWRQWNQARYTGKDWTKLRAGRTDVPNENQRRIVVQGDRLYTTLAYRDAMSILDAATGEVLTTVKQTKGTREILLCDGVAVCFTQQVPSKVAQRRGAKQPIDAALVGVDARSGKMLWRNESGSIRPLGLAIDNGRVVYLSGKSLTALDLKTGNRLWQVHPKWTSPRTLLTAEDVIVMQGGSRVAAFDATDGKLLWEKTVGAIGGGEGDDLFVVDGLVWRGMIGVDDQGKQVGKSPNSLVIGWDLHTGDAKRRIQVNNLRSPEHHHRCYRNKATSRYLISSYEGAEFLDFQADNHGQNNWVRGACRFGMMPANGMLYVPSDQCFCQPGSKLLGYAALITEPEVARKPVDDALRLKKGPAFGPIDATDAKALSKEDWPTFRHDAARRGTTESRVSSELAIDWRVELGGPLTPPVAVGDRVYVAQSDAHTVVALDAASGQRLWLFTAGGRIDSPPTIHRGRVLFGSKDGLVYCLRASDGELIWRFLAAPHDRRIVYFDQVESAWPVHGSVLVTDDVAYFSAGRSTYLDGGIRLWGLDPATGKILHKGLLAGPHRKLDGPRDLAFFLPGANSDTLVAQGGFLYMRQKKMKRSLEEVDVPVLSSKGAQDVGMHVFSTAGLLDDSWYNRTFWMYSKRWPGFQLANQAPKTGQLLVVDDEKTYAVRAFYHRNVHSPMHFPGTKGYLVFADANSNEPQIVGEKGSREPVRWLPQSDYSRGRGSEVRKLESDAFGLDKMIGYTRAEPPVWAEWHSVRVRAMTKAADTLFFAGPPDVYDPKDPFVGFEGRAGARLIALASDDGKKLSETKLSHPPIFDGLIAAGGRLFISLQDGSLVSLGSLSTGSELE